MTGLSAALVITTIAAPNAAITRYRDLLSGWHVVVVGDRKTPTPWHVEGIDFIPYDPSSDGLATLIPADRYSRKNLGYLAAIRAGAEVIVETDDDNFPYDTFGTRLSRRVVGSPVCDRGWVNVYRAFTNERIWPRGFPLSNVGPSMERPPRVGSTAEADCPIQQFLADGDPDVDAIYRLILGGEVTFVGEPLLLRPGTYTPLNSQNTVWWPEAYRLLYLPSHVSFRACDIWRGLIAMAIAHARGWSLAVLPPTVRQERNPHDLMRDFRDEIPVYLETAPALDRLTEAAASTTDDSDALRASYEALVDLGYVPREELVLVDAWNDAMGTLT